MDPLTMMALVQAGSGAYRYARAQKGISDLEAQDRRKFMDASGPLQENKLMSQQRMKYGLRPESRQLALNEQMRQERNLLSTPASGQLRDQLGRTAAATRGQFGLQLSAQDQAIRDAAAQNIMQTNQQLMQLDMQDISQENQEYLQMMGGYGQARQDARKTILGAAQGVMTGAMMGYYDGMGGAKTTAPKTEKPLIKTEEKPYVPADPSLTQKQTPLELNLGGAPRSKYDNADFYAMGEEGVPRYQTFPTTPENTIAAPGQMSTIDELTGGMSSLQMGPSGPPGPYVAPEFPKAKLAGQYDPYQTMPDLMVDVGPGRHMVQAPSGEQVVVPSSVKTFGDLDNFLNPNYNAMGMAGRADQFPRETGYEGMTPQPMLPNKLPGITNMSGKLGPYATPMQYRRRYGRDAFLQGLSENRLSPYSMPR